MKVDSATIVQTIRECEQRGGPVRGADVRRELEKRFGAKVGTDRLYRLLRAHQPEIFTREERIRNLEAQVHQLTAAMEQERGRAELAELREQSHLERWGAELHALREKVRQYENRYGLGAGELEAKLNLQRENLRLRIENESLREQLARVEGREFAG